MLTLDWFPSPLIIIAEFADLAHDLEQKDDLLKALQEYAATVMPRNIESGGDGSWPPLEEQTIERGGDVPLIRTGELLGSVGDPGLWTMSNDQVALEGVGSPAYAEFHITGTEFMPERNYAYFLPQDTDECERITFDWLDRIVG
jgi:hypothetical protein